MASAIASFGYETELIQSYNSKIQKSDLLVIPGVGHFKKAAGVLDSNGFRDMVGDHINRGSGIVGICLGMQLLMHKSDESPSSSGLGILQGRVLKLSSLSARVPNVGWNSITLRVNDPLTKFLEEGDCFYFTHSYFAEVSQDVVRASSRHGDFVFPAIVQQGNIVGIQFHPEKSGPKGRRVLQDIILECAN